MAKEDSRPQVASPTLPLPPPKITLDEFFEVASAAALRALDAHARRQIQGPLPDPWLLNPQIWVGIIASGHGGLVNPGKTGPGSAG